MLPLQLHKKLERENRRNKTSDERMTEMILVIDPVLLVRDAAIAPEFMELRVDVEKEAIVPWSMRWKRKIVGADVMARFVASNYWCSPTVNLFTPPDPPLPRRRMSPSLFVWTARTL